MRSATIILAGLVSCASVPGLAERDVQRTPTGAVSQQRVEPATPSVSDIAERAVQSVVNVASHKKREGPQGPFFTDPLFRQFFFGPGRGAPRPQERYERSLGSGVVIDADAGVIVTNNHVVQGADEVEVSLPDGRQLQATVAGSDPKSDLAVLRLSDPPDGLAALPIGDSDALRLGETVLAIGNPFGVGQTVTMGIVSAVGRADVGIVDYEDFIQTDAAINPGDSGGALVNLRGELVGINTAIMSRSGGYQGIGFAIPTEMVEPIVANILDDGTVQRGYLGIMMQEIDRDLADAMGLDDTHGVVVSDVVEDSPAAAAGLEVGDVILELDGEPVPAMGRFRNRIAAAGPGSPFELRIRRDGKRRTLKGTLGLLPGADGDGTAEHRSDQLGGLSLRVPTDQDRARLQLPSRVSGVLVDAIEPGSPAGRAGLRPGDVIVQVNRRPVTSPEEVEQRLQKGRTNLVLLYRQGRTLFLVLEG